ncbi:hypothetical protein [Alicyclobacillus sp. SO9]|uniref:hypothetical protein n=1 Tax=Alicyclobacillus sp. SO9 TaxID=2665646 RepID=UPI0018E8905A|nr:hypothetical protein [Alicyclobacillus sp. SO9]QQE78168.1 hypothetical protein GI364_20135 [Alicyclobacillus sp. SO9]
MRRSLKQEQLQQHLSEWQETALPSDREERIQRALQQFQEHSVREHPGDEDDQHYARGVRAGVLPWLVRWRGRLLGAGIMGGAAVLLLVVALKSPHGLHAVQHGTDSSASSTASAQTSEAVAKSSSGSSSGTRQSAAANAGRQASSHTGSIVSQHSASGGAKETTGITSSKWKVPDHISKIQVQLTSASKDGGSNHSSGVSSRTITSSAVIERLRKSINSSQPASPSEPGCNGTGQAANLTFVTSSGEKVAVKVNNCGYITLHGVTLSAPHLWPQLSSILKK